jgi:hypothetical protein
MLQYERLKNKPRLFKCLTGLTVEAFNKLLPAFRRAYQEDLKKRDRQRGEPRQRRPGGGTGDHREQAGVHTVLLSDVPGADGTGFLFRNGTAAGE